MKKNISTTKLRDLQADIAPFERCNVDDAFNDLIIKRHEKIKASEILALYPKLDKTEAYLLSKYLEMYLDTSYLSDISYQVVKEHFNPSYISLNIFDIDEPITVNQISRYLEVPEALARKIFDIVINIEDDNYTDYIKRCSYKDKPIHRKFYFNNIYLQLVKSNEFDISQKDLLKRYPLLDKTEGYLLRKYLAMWYSDEIDAMAYKMAHLSDYVFMKISNDSSAVDQKAQELVNKGLIGINDIADYYEIPYWLGAKIYKLKNEIEDEENEKDKTRI